MSAPLSDVFINAMNSPDSKEKRSLAYSQFLKTVLVVPTLKTENEPTNDQIISLDLEGKRFIPAFSHQRYLKLWAGKELSAFSFIHIQATNLLSLLKKEDYLCLDLNTAHYKEFSPEEITYLNQMVDSVGV